MFNVNKCSRLLYAQPSGPIRLTTSARGLTAEAEHEGTNLEILLI